MSNERSQFQKLEDKCSLHKMCFLLQDKYLFERFKYRQGSSGNNRV